MDLVKFFIFLAIESERSCRVIKPIKNGREGERRERVLKFFYGQNQNCIFHGSQTHISVFLFWCGRFLRILPSFVEFIYSQNFLILIDILKWPLSHNKRGIQTISQKIQLNVICKKWNSTTNHGLPETGS